MVERIHPGTIYTFRLGGNTPPPEKLPALDRPVTQLTTDASPTTIGQGYNLFRNYCSGCHWGTGRGSGSIPDLISSSDQVFKAYEDILLNGLLAAQGMPDFGADLTGTDVENIKAYILFTANSLQEDPENHRTRLAEYQRLADMAEWE